MGCSGEFAAEQIAKHHKKEGIWVVVNEQVLDVANNQCEFTSHWRYRIRFLTCFKIVLTGHPRGEPAIILYAGRDATDELSMLHKPKVGMLALFTC